MRIFFCILSLFFAVSSSDAKSLLDPITNRFPRASAHDFSDIVPAPAGKKGFLKTKGNHFVWEDGSRARFWGINVANLSLQESDAEIEAMLKNFRAAGFNLVRLHHFDERLGILDLNAPTSGNILPERIKKLDFWIAKARENGLYIYLDLLDYRRFKEGDGVINAELIGRSAKPYAVFDKRLIELQKEYAVKLLKEHKNSYTGLSYADDPTVVMLEIYSENGLFMRRGLWRSMPEPYATQFKTLWNDWLLKTYGTTAKLREAWVGPDGQSALFENESLENKSVQLPAMTWETNRLPPEELPYSALARRSDGARFAVEVQRRYFKEMKRFLREEVGFKAPLSVTGRYDDLSDISSQAAELDFIGCNFYYDHPYWGTGKPQWQLPSYYHNRNPISDQSDRSIAATLALARVKDKPFVVREWNYCYPNTNRGAGMLEAAAFACLQDIDAMILFTYETNPTNKVGYFSVRSDPARWQMAAVGARMFLKDMVAPAKNRVVIPYSNIDLYAYEMYHQPLYNLAWTSRVENDFFNGNYYLAHSGIDLIVPPGRSSHVAYTGASQLNYTRINRRDLAGNPNNALKKLTPLGAENSRMGFLDAHSKKITFDNLRSEEVAGAAIDALKAFRGVGNDSAAYARGISRSDTGEITRNSLGGRISVKTPQLQIYAGKLAGVGGEKTGLSLTGATEGALAALSLDGLPLVKSRRYVIKMTADARNIDEKLRRDPRFLRQPNGQWMLDDFGKGAIISGGKNSATPLTISLNGKLQLKLWNTGSAWELYVDGDKRSFYCDFAGAKFALSDGKVQTMG
jgi:hypothetical protein